jgi:hypothetical protein
MPLAEGRIHAIRVEFVPRPHLLNKKYERTTIFTPSTIFASPPHDMVPHFGGGREILPRDFALMKGQVWACGAVGRHRL